MNNTGSYKLYYYNNTKLFNCYTECKESFDIFDLVTRNKVILDNKWEFKDSLFYVMDLTGYDATHQPQTGNPQHRIDDWDFLNKYRVRKTPKIEIPEYNPYVLDIYKQYYHKKWVDEGISPQAMKKFNIKFDTFNNKIIIPHYDIKGHLIGVRGRSLNEEDVQQGRKYMPVKVENIIYNHPISCNLYGLSHNLSTIRRLKKALIVEGEKSVLKVESFYPNRNFSIAVCGDKISDFQKALILKDVDEIIIGFDKTEDFINNGQNQSIRDLRNLAKKFSPYVKTYILVDRNNYLNLKDAPVDQGKHVLEELMRNKVEIRSIGG